MRNFWTPHFVPLVSSHLPSLRASHIHLLEYTKFLKLGQMIQTASGSHNVGILEGYFF